LCEKEPAFGAPLKWSVERKDEKGLTFGKINVEKSRARDKKKRILSTQEEQGD
jgi:hypothetical protein